jgi:5'-nucleotidase
LNLLVTNDDGIQAEGIYFLAKALLKEHNVLLVAPDYERSGSGHSTSFKTPIKFKKQNLVEGAECYSLNGTPVDCVKFGINFLAKNKIDLVVSGINHGRNLGTDVIYSGTVSAGVEALIEGYNAVTVSYSGINDFNFEYGADFIAKNLEKLYKFASLGCVINVNFPKCDVKDIKGIKAAPLGRQMYNDKYKLSENSNDEYILDKLPHLKVENPENCDIMYNIKKYITITPLSLDMTDYKALNKINTDGLII